MEQQKSRTIENLKDAFDARKNYYSNRASCIYPVHLRPGTDLHIVYLNYWTLKNGISADKLLINFRVYDKAGFLVLRETQSSVASHNQISIRKILSERTMSDLDNFDGMVEVETISTANIRFPFPGIIGIYQAGTLFSTVHAAGRVKNPDEPQRVIYTQESDWTCKFGENVTPFFHYFNGPTVPRKDTISVVLRAANGKPIETKDVSIAHLPAFGSELFLVSDLFDNALLKDGCFVSVSVEHNSIFPRLVVGNYFRDAHYLEVTHSFPIIEKNDYCRLDEKVSFQSMLCAYTNAELDLKVHVFPTNCEGDFTAKIMHQRHDHPALVEKVGFVNYTQEMLSEPITYQLEDTERFLCVQMSGARVPSRFNGSYIYTVKHLDSAYSTDIADGADSSAYPPKYRHWGYALVDEGFDTAILVRNSTHHPASTRASNGVLKLYGDDFQKFVNVRVEAESAASIKVSEHINLGKQEKGQRPRFISWLLEMEEPTCETFWVGYRETDGAIFGDHGM